jgi:hypothetical protein
VSYAVISVSEEHTISSFHVELGQVREVADHRLIEKEE